MGIELTQSSYANEESWAILEIISKSVFLPIPI